MARCTPPTRFCLFFVLSLSCLFFSPSVSSSSSESAVLSSARGGSSLDLSISDSLTDPGRGTGKEDESRDGNNSRDGDRGRDGNGDEGGRRQLSGVKAGPGAHKYTRFINGELVDDDGSPGAPNGDEKGNGGIWVRHTSCTIHTYTSCGILS